MKFTDENSKEWMWRGTYRVPRLGEHYMDGTGQIYQSRDATKPERAIVCPVTVIHEFGGVRLEETGEVRQAEANEWWLNGNGYPEYMGCSTIGVYKILRPYKGE